MADYDIQLDDKFGAMALIDIPAEIAAHDPWFNETLTTVNESVVRLGVIQGDFHWHHHDDTDEFFLVLEGQLLIDSAPGQGTHIEARVPIQPASGHTPLATSAARAA